jgi:hypothetical protein
MSYNTILATAPLTTQNYHLKMIGTSIGNSLIWDNGTNVGIGNTNTTYTFDVTGTGRFNGTSASPLLSLTNTTGGTLADFTITENVGLIINSYEGATARSIDLKVAGTSALLIASTGAATFSSSVTMAYGGTPRLTLQDTDAGAGNVGILFKEATNDKWTLASVGGAFQFFNEATSSNAIWVTATNNVGIGVTPSAWYTGYTALQVGFSGAIFSNRTSADTNTTMIANNAFLNSGATNWIYQNNGFATRYTQVSGGHEFYTAASGTAGNAITWLERMRITSGGNVGIGFAGYSDMRLAVRGAGTSSATFGLRIEDSSANALFQVRNDGLIETGTQTNSPYNISATGRTAILSSSGVLGYLVSTRESKANIESIKSIDFINQLNPVQFNYRKKDNISNTFTDELYDNITYGFIADEVEKVNKELVFYNSDGSTLAGVEYNSMIAILTKAVQEQNETITSLQEQITELKQIVATK